VTRRVDRVMRFMRSTKAAAPLSAFAAVIGLCANIWGATVALADPNDPPRFHRGACEGAYPGWLRGVADGYNDLYHATLDNPRAAQQMDAIPNPRAITSASEAERLGYRAGLKAGYAAGVSYGTELGRAARTPDSNTKTMDQATEQLGAYVKRHCGHLIAALDWDTIPMNAEGKTTATSLNEAQMVMHLAAAANQIAIGAEKMARDAQEAEAKGDKPAAIKSRAAAQADAQLAANFAQMAQSHAAAGREEAVQGIMDAQDAADRAKKAADSAGGSS
jgi:hypothetical protein